jgi:hypothetical protein
LIDGDDEEVNDMIAAVAGIEGVQKPTVKKFLRELAKLRKKGETFPLPSTMTSSSASAR